MEALGNSTAGWRGNTWDDRNEKTFRCCQAPAPRLFVPHVELWLTGVGRSGAGQEQAVLAPCCAWAGGRNAGPCQQRCQCRASLSRAAPVPIPLLLEQLWRKAGASQPLLTGRVLPGGSQLQVPPIPLQIAQDGMNPSSMYCIPVLPNCSLGSGQGENGPCLPLLPCSGCRRLAHELAVNQNARGRQFSASETCPHQALGEGGEPQVSK